MGQQCLSPFDHASSNEETVYRSLPQFKIDQEIVQRSLPQLKIRNSAVFQSNQVKNESIKEHAHSANTTSDKIHQNLKFFWIDPRINDYQNCRNFSTFRSRLSNIVGVSSLSSLKCELRESSSNDLIVVISAASLKDQEFKYMQEDERIADIILFCRNKERAELLMRKDNIPKIKAAGYTIGQVLQKLADLQRNYIDKGIIKDENIINPKV